MSRNAGIATDTDKSRAADAEWKRIRKVVFSREGYRCEGCSTALKAGSQAHHVYKHRLREPLVNDPRCIAALCGRCHRSVHGSRPDERLQYDLELAVLLRLSLSLNPDEHPIDCMRRLERGETPDHWQDEP